MTQAAKNAVFSMVGMIDNILEMSRIESAQFTASPTPVDLRDLADAVAKLFSYAAESKGIQLNVTVADNLPPLVTADSGHLRQILVHLMSNAIKFTEQGGIDLRLTAEETSIPEKPYCALLCRTAESALIRSTTGPYLTCLPSWMTPIPDHMTVSD